jgi:hypothetical protein
MQAQDPAARAGDGDAGEQPHSGAAALSCFRNRCGLNHIASLGEHCWGQDKLSPDE